MDKGEEAKETPEHEATMDHSDSDFVALEEGLATETTNQEAEEDSSNNTLAEAEVVLEPTAPAQESSERKHLWDRLPVATPILDAEVEVWDYDRPTFRKRWGFGFFGRRSRQEESSPSQQDPIFTEEDRANPFRCVCKAMGIVVALPFYLLYFVFCKVDVWAMELCRLMDWVLFRPLGWVLDCLSCGMAYIVWGIFVYLLAPFYKIGVYLTRILQHVVLCLTKYGILMPIEWIYLYLVLAAFTFLFQQVMVPIWTMVTATASFIYNKLMVPCCQTIKTASTTVWHMAVAGWQATSNGIARVCQAAYQSLVLPCKQAISRTSTMTYKKCMLPFSQGFLKGLTFLARGICKGWAAVRKTVVTGISFLCYTLLWQRMIHPAFQGFGSGIRWSYNNVLVPLGKGVYRFLIQPVLQLFRAFYAFLLQLSRAFYAFLLVPIGSGILAVLGFLRDAGRAVYETLRDMVRIIYETIVVPTGKGMSSVVRLLAQGIHAILQALGNLMQSVAIVTSKTMRSIGSFFANLLRI